MALADSVALLERFADLTDEQAHASIVNSPTAAGVLQHAVKQLLERLAGEPAWLPIDTAKKNDTPRLLWCPQGVERAYGAHDAPALAANICIGWWGGFADRFGKADDGWVSIDVQTEVYSGSAETGSWTEHEWTRVKPTHWMPLPQDPEPTGHSEPIKP